MTHSGKELPAATLEEAARPAKEKQNKNRNRLVRQRSHAPSHTRCQAGQGLDIGFKAPGVRCLAKAW